MAMAVQGSRQQQGDGGVKVKFIETQFISSDAASFKSVVQRLTGKSPATSQPPQPKRPRPCRPAFASGGSVVQQHPPQAGWTDEQAGHHNLIMTATKQEPPRRLEELHELCDFADLLYATAGGRRDGGGFPY